MCVLVQLQIKIIMNDFRVTHSISVNLDILSNILFKLLFSGKYTMTVQF